MVAEAGYFCKEVKNRNDSKWEPEFIYVVRDSSEILEIQSKLIKILI